MFENVRVCFEAKTKDGGRCPVKKTGLRFHSSHC